MRKFVPTSKMKQSSKVKKYKGIEMSIKRIIWKKTFGDMILQYAYSIGSEESVKMPTDGTTLVTMSMIKINGEDMEAFDGHSQYLSEYHLAERIKKLENEGFVKKEMSMI